MSFSLVALCLNRHCFVNFLMEFITTLFKHNGTLTQWKHIHKEVRVVIRYHGTWLSDSGSMMVGVRLSVSATCPQAGQM